MALYKLNGDYYLTYSLQGRKHRVLIGPDLARALARRKAITREALNGEDLPAWLTPTTFAEGATKYQQLHGRFLTGASNPHFHRVVVDALGPVRLVDLSDHLQRVFDTWCAQFSFRSAVRYMSQVQAIVNRLREWGDIDGIDPVRRLRRHMPDHRTTTIPVGTRGSS